MLHLIIGKIALTDFSSALSLAFEIPGALDRNDNNLGLMRSRVQFAFKVYLSRGFIIITYLHNVTSRQG